MANIDIAERLFVYAREKQQKDLANNLIKEEDVIDFSESDFTSFNTGISALLVGLDNEQISAFSKLMQEKIDNNINEVIIPGKSGFSLNIPSVISTVKQVVKDTRLNSRLNNNQIENSQSDYQNNYSNISPEERFRLSAENEIEFLSNLGGISNEYKELLSSNISDWWSIWNSFSNETQDSVYNEAVDGFYKQCPNKDRSKFDVIEESKKTFKFPKEMLEKFDSNPSFKKFFDFALARIATEFIHGNFYADGKTGKLDIRAVEIYMEQFAANLPDNSPLYPYLDTIKSCVIDNFQDYANVISSDSRYTENLLTKDFLLSSSDPSDIYYNTIFSEEELHLKMSSMLRKSMGIMGNFPKQIEDKIGEFISKSIIQDPDTHEFSFKDDIDFDELKKSFTFDWEKDKDLVILMGSEENVRFAHDYEEFMKNGVKYLKELPDAMVNLVHNSKRSTEFVNSLKYTEEDVKTLRPYIEAFSNTKIDIDDEKLCAIINDTTQRDSTFTHVNVEKMMQAIALYSKDFDPKGENYELNSSNLSAALNNINFYRSKEFSKEMVFCDFEELQDLDINHWSARDLSFDDVHEYLEDRSDQIKKTRAYKKLFPSKVSLDNGFLYDFDAYLLKSSCFDSKTQLDILSNPKKDADFLTFASAMCLMYRQGKKNISSSIDRKQQEINLDILKKTFLSDFSQSSLNAITVDSMAPLVDKLITGDLPPLATTLASHIDLKHFGKFEDFLNGKNVSIDFSHPGFLSAESYQYYKESMQDKQNIENSSQEQPTEDKQDNHLIEQKKPKGLLGFISSFVKKFKETDFESGLFNRLKESYNYAKDSISNYSDMKDEINDKTEEFKPNQGTNSSKTTELDSFSQSLRNEYAEPAQNITNNDEKAASERQNKPSDGRANSDDNDELDI